jgi:YidC/Oxa1 family membrane protein insertase
MQDQKNLILAIVISVVILGAYQFLYEAPRQESLQAEQQATAELTPSDPASPVTAPPTGTATAPTVTVPGGVSGSAGGAVQAAPTKADFLQGQRVKIENPRVDGSINLTGARIDDLTLKDYDVDLSADSAKITLLSPAGASQPYFADFGWIDIGGSKAPLPTAETQWTADRKQLTAESPVTLSWTNGQGLTFRRTFAIDQNYMITVTQRVDNNGDAPVTLRPYGLISRHGTPDTLGFFILHEGPLGVFNDTLKEVDYDDLQEVGKHREAVQSTGGWIGYTDKNWLTALVPDQKNRYDASFNYQAGEPGQLERYQIDVLIDPVTVERGGVREVSSRLFAGAKEVALLETYQESLGIDRFDLAIDWGWFPFLTHPLWVAIDYFNKMLGNFGLAIILLTVIIKFLFLPLAYKSYVSMSKMKTLQPEMVKLRERHGDDRTKLNQEMMALYKREKVNPVSGCLPMILQIPVFFALYKVLFVTIEMRHQPFFGWIQDLSAPDPTSVFNAFGLIPFQPPDFLLIGVWPLAMGLSMYLQQKMNPQPPDPIQAKIFLFMPIFFTFLLARFPAGLVIYWTVNNVLTIGQQWFIMRRTRAKT